MDLTPFKLDINELLDEFTKGNFTTLADIKKMWMTKKFSYIHEAKPTSNLALFIQSLYAHCISHMISTGVLSQRLGGLYSLYCLYEIQPYRPHFKIYLSLVGGSITQRVDEITKLQNRRAQIACEKLLANTHIEDYLQMDLRTELELEMLKKMSREYAKAKELAVKEASRVVEVDDIKHIAEHDKMVGDMVEEIVKEWDTQKEAFYKQTGINHQNEIVAVKVLMR